MNLSQPHLSELTAKRPATHWGIGDELWFTRIQLDPRDLRISRMLHDAQGLKSWLLKAFASTNREVNGMLYSVQDLNAKCAVVHLQSHARQNWWFAADAPHLKVEEPKRVDAVIDALPVGARFAFSVDVSVTMKVRIDGETRRTADGTERSVWRRRHLADPETQVRWLAHHLIGAAVIDHADSSRTIVVRGLQRNVGRTSGENRIVFMLRPASCSRPAGVSPVWVGTGAPSSRPRFVGEIRRAERGVESLFAEGATTRSAASSEPCSLVRSTTGEPSRSCHGEGHVRQALFRGQPGGSLRGMEGGTR